MSNPQPQNLPKIPRHGPWDALPWLSLVVFVGFSWLPLSYYRMVGWPWILLWQGGWLALLGWGVVRLRWLQRPFYRLGYGFDGWLLAIGIILVLSSVRSPFPRVALWNASLAASYGLGLYAYRNWENRNQGSPSGDRQAKRSENTARRQLGQGLVVVAAGVALISLALWRPDAAMWGSENFWLAIRNHQPLGHHNFVGGYLVLVLPLAVAMAWAASGIGRLGFVLAAVLIATALYVSGSRGAALGLVVWLVVAWMGGIARAKPSQRWRWGLMGLATLGGVGLALATNPRIRGWLSTAGTTDGPTLDRWFMLRLGGNILRDRPLVGVGPGVMSRVSNLYRPIETGAGLDHIQQLHNTPVQLAGELGWPGLILYLVGIVLGGRLWWRLWQLPLARADRHLLGGIGGGFLAYGVSSLTDYQLENIAIAGTLVALVVLLLRLAEAYGLPQAEVKPSQRRLASLALWTWMGLLFYVWLPFTLTVGFGALADGAFYQQQLNLADSRWHKATLLSPWDPTAAAVASETLYELDAVLGDSEAKDNVRSLVLDYARQAQAAAPNDVWFNQNLAVLYQLEDPAQALPYAHRAVRLLPRNLNHGYWLLGELLLATEQEPEAIAAFTQEALVNPESLTYPGWNQPPLQALYPAVVEQTLAEYDQLLAEVDPSDPGYGSLYENRTVLGWWVGQPLDSLDVNHLRPIVQALFLAETNPQRALAQLEDHLATDASPSAQLLAAWLDPATHWPAYLEGFDPPLDVDTILIEESLSTQPLRPWLTAVASPPSRGQRTAIAFAYRNYQARYITLMLAPENLEVHPVIARLELFRPWPREFPALDRRLASLRPDVS